ncbi:MAG TPA: DUF2269 family protein [Actinomycetota bacterium]|jgi:hypothetical protein|nr:DUF2269 family protein [Actinomycetota bacterium]
MLAIAYNWWKLLHVLGVLAFVMYHGVSMVVALRLRTERDRTRIAELLQFSGSSVRGMYVSLAWLTVFGIVAGVQSGIYTRQGWFWVSIGILVAVSAEMSIVARPYYQRLKEAVEIRPSGVPRRSDEELAAMLRSRLSLTSAGFGFVALVFIAYLMIFKPF